MEYYYELFNERSHGKSKIVSCRVFNPNETQIEVFDFLVTDRIYEAWTYDTFSQIAIDRRLEIEKEINNTIKV